MCEWLEGECGGNGGGVCVCVCVCVCDEKYIFICTYVVIYWNFSSLILHVFMYLWIYICNHQYISANQTVTTDRLCNDVPAGSITNATNMFAPFLPFDCGPGLVIIRNFSSIIDRSCGPCPISTYSNITNVFACVPWPVCSPSLGVYVQTNGTAVTPQVTILCILVYVFVPCFFCGFYYRYMWFIYVREYFPL